MLHLKRCTQDTSRASCATHESLQSTSGSQPSQYRALWLRVCSLVIGEFLDSPIGFLCCLRPVRSSDRGHQMRHLNTCGQAISSSDYIGYLHVLCCIRGDCTWVQTAILSNHSFVRLEDVDPWPRVYSMLQHAMCNCASCKSVSPCTSGCSVMVCHG